MKKLVFLLIILVLAIALAACGGSTETDAPETDPTATETNPPETDPPEPEHVHDVQVEEQAPTCSERGFYSEVCKTCGETLTVTALPKIACTPSGEATCTADSVCTVCGTVIEAAKGHTWGDKQIVQATCKADGKETITCTVCQTVEETVLPMIPHAIGVVSDEKEASCTEDGYKKGQCVICGDEVIETIEAVHHFVVESFYTAEDGVLMAVCFQCGDVPVRIDTRLQLDFDKELEEELAEQEHGNLLRLVDSTVSPMYKKRHAVVSTNGDRTVLAPTHPVAIDFDKELLIDARYILVSFDYYIKQMLQPDNPSDPIRASLFKMIPGFQNGVKATLSRETHMNFVKFTYGHGFVFSQYGTLKDIEAGVPLINTKADTWYNFMFVIDNVTGEAYAYLDGQFIAMLQVDPEEGGMYGVSEQIDKTFEGYYSMVFGDGYVQKHGGQYDNFTISVIR